jgi:hypothetical protein
MIFEEKLSGERNLKPVIFKFIRIPITCFGKGIFTNHPGEPGHHSQSMQHVL